MDVLKIMICPEKVQSMQRSESKKTERKEKERSDTSDEFGLLSCHLTSNTYKIERKSSLLGTGRGVIAPSCIRSPLLRYSPNIEDGSAANMALGLFWFEFLKNNLLQVIQKKRTADRTFLVALNKHKEVERRPGISSWEGRD